MLEKIGLPPKPSQRGNNWVVDATHCQGCSSQFSFINRKHHCRRCGGIFCGSCTSHRMVLRGQGDSPVRICEPCKQLEEAARFEMRHGNRSRVGKASSKSSLKSDDDIVSEVLGSTRKEFLASGSGSSSKIVSRSERATSQNARESASLSARSTSIDEFSHEVSEKEPTSPEDLRRQAVEEKGKYKILKGEGKSDEALRAFKRGKELERQADALEISLRRNRRKSVLSRNVEEVQAKDETGGSRRGNKASRVEGKEKDDLMAELRELGWSDMDLHNEDKKGTNSTLEGEFSSLLGEVSENTKKDKGGNNPKNNSQVLALKKKALALKREGNLAEAKEELKRAKVLEKQLEEQELLGAAEDSDDEFSALIRSMGGDDKQELSSNLGQGNDFDLSSLIGAADRIVDGNFDVTDEDMEDPEIAAALKSMGWADDTDVHESAVPQMVSVDKEALSNEILSLKREALAQKRAGNVSEAMTLLRKAKLLEKDLESLDSSQSATSHIVDSSRVENVSTTKNVDSKPATRKSKLMIQRELLGLKKNALALKREGRFDEAEEELKKGKILEQQLEDMDNSPLNVKPMPAAASTQVPDLAYDNLVVENEEVENVTDQDMSDPTYLSLLKNLGWQEEHNDHVAPLSAESSAPRPIDEPSISRAAPAVGRPRKSKAELQRELLGVKRKALALRRQGENEKSEELLTRAQDIETQISEMEHPIKEVQLETSAQNENTRQSEDEAQAVTENDMHDPAMLSILKRLGWNGEEQETMAGRGKYDENSAMSVHSDATSVTQTSVAVKRSKGEIQRELLNLKRKAFALRRKGESEEAEEVQNMAKVLEAQIEEIEATKRVNPKESMNEEKPRHFGSPSNQEERENEIDDKDSNSKFGVVSEMTNHGMTSSDLLIPLNAPLVESTAVTVPPLADSGNLIDLLTGDDWSGSQMPAEKDENLVLLDKKPRSHESNTVERDEKAHDSESHPAEKHGPPSDEMALKQDILARKRKAVALKREGKLVEAREELREAKLLERRLLPQVDANSATVVAHEPVPTTSNASSPSDSQKEPALSSTTSAKPLSSRERFKLQQKSLAHKRQALKLRREGRTEEADAELELARSLEAQLEESSGHDSNSAADATGAENDMGVEDFLDPQLLSALRAIGIADAGVAPRVPVPDTPQPSKPSVAASESPQQERIQLEEKIKAEKVKAVNLKRSGNQAEALEAFRKAKLLEKKLNSLMLTS